MRVAWHELEKSKFLPAKRWHAKIGPCTLFVGEVDPFIENDIWREHHREGETLYSYKICIYDFKVQPTHEEIIATGTISDSTNDHHASAVKARVVNIARQDPRCKQSHRQQIAPSPELVTWLSELVMKTITHAYETWRQRSDYWKTHHVEQHLGHTNPYNEPVITIGYLLGEAEAHNVDNTWWEIYEHRRRSAVENVVRKLVRQGRLNQSTAYDRNHEREVKAFSPA
jgi:hypothetical protein